ncbi:MAG: type II toxin-antitoxin system VapC family toxin [Betaproteobacteria bacterium]|nr:type II toxin-antitoxin system VapC family toxin [Betaproteobacteria bacterium]
MFLLDTNVVSELRPGKRQPSATVRTWAAHHPAEQFYLSAVVLLELWLGYELKARVDAHQAAGLKVWIEGLEMEFADRTLPFTGRGARLCAPMHAPNPRAWRDSVIAATAIEHGMTLVTRNLKDFEGTGVRLVDPFV